MNSNLECFEFKNTLKRRLISFFGLILLISIPIWILAPLSTKFIPEGLPVNHIGFVLVFAPIIVAYILIRRDYGKENAKELIKRAFDYKRIEVKVWYLPILFLLPIIYILSLGIMILLGIPFVENSISFGVIPIIFIVMIIFAIGEEVGWQGYAFDMMESKWNTLKASILLGIIWASWHIPLYIIQEPPGGFIWIAGQCLYTVVLRILIVLIYNNANKSVFTAVMIHAISNLCSMVFPISSSPLGPLISSIIMIIIIIVGTQLRSIKG